MAKNADLYRVRRVDDLRKDIIDRILAIRNEDLLKKLLALLESTNQEDVVKLTPDQRLMLEMSERDLSEGRTISQEELDALDSEWLKRQ